MTHDKVLATAGRRLWSFKQSLTQVRGYMSKHFLAVVIAIVLLKVVLAAITPLGYDFVLYMNAIVRGDTSAFMVTMDHSCGKHLLFLELASSRTWRPSPRHQWRIWPATKPLFADGPHQIASCFVRHNYHSCRLQARNAPV